MFVCVNSVFVLPCVGSGLARADHSSKESYQLSISVGLRNLIKRRPGLDMGCSAEEEEKEPEDSPPLSITKVCTPSRATYTQLKSSQLSS
jgi:hypothetical protein